MDLRRLRIGEWAMAATGLALLLSLFLRWYEVEANDVMGPTKFSGWEALSVIDVLLALVALAAIVAVPVVARAHSPSPGITHETLVFLGSIVALLLCLVRLVDAPRELLVPRAGAYLGTLAALGLLVSCLIAMRDERLSSAGGLTDATGAPVASAPEIETLPAPRP